MSAAAMPESGPAPLHWGILGAGMLGLTLAYRLVQAGHRVTVVEAAPELGGLTSAWQVGDVTWDRYYHVTLLSDFHLRSLLAELDLEDEIQWGVTRTNFYAGDTLYPLNNVIDYLRLPVLGPIDKARLALTILYGNRIENGVALESLPVADWLIRLSGRRTFERLWQPLLRSKLGPNHARVSAAYIWSVIRRFYGARRGGLKTEMFGYVPGGYGRIIATLRDRLEAAGARIEYGCPVRGVHKQGDEMQVETANGSLTFDRAVMTFAAPLAAKLAPDLSGDEQGRLNAIDYQGVVCASLLLKQPLGGAYLTYITDDTLPFTTVIEMSSLIGPEETGGHYLVYLPKYLPSDDPFFDRPDDEIERIFLEGLFRMFPHVGPGDVSAFRISRTRQVLALATLDYSRNLPDMQTSVPGLWIANSAHIVNGSLAVNETVALANATADRLLKAEGAAL
jgi:protoporphyrinogen oxidase